MLNSYNLNQLSGSYRFVKYKEKLPHKYMHSIGMLLKIISWPPLPTRAVNIMYQYGLEVERRLRVFVTH